MQFLNLACVVHYSAGGGGVMALSLDYSSLLKWWHIIFEGCHVVV
jgi:hypothetical protein